MKKKTTSAVAVIVVCLGVLISIGLAAEDKSTLKAPNGVAFSEFRGYESWQNVAPSVTQDGIKSILANPVMIKAYKDGIPANGKPFPDGSMIVKIECRCRPLRSRTAPGPDLRTHRSAVAGYRRRRAGIFRRAES